MRNVEDAVSLLEIADAALEALTSIAERQRELTQQALNGTLSDTQRAALDTEFQELAIEHSRILASTSFNGRTLFSDLSGVLDVQVNRGSLGVRLQSGQEAGTPIGLGTYTNYLASNSHPGGEFLIYAFNGDGRDDVISISADSSSTVGRMEVFQANADGSLSYVAGNNFLLPSTSPIVLIQFRHMGGDQFETTLLHGDGIRSGYTFRVDSDGTIYSILSNGGSVGYSDQGKTSATADVNGDGIEDLVQLIGRTLYSRVHQTTIATSFTPDDLQQDPLSIRNVENATTTLQGLEDHLELLNSSRSALGTSLSQLGAAKHNVQSSVLQLTSAEDRLR